jgi:hypothetical protein
MKLAEKSMLTSSDKLVLHQFNYFYSTRWEKIGFFIFIFLALLFLAILFYKHPDILNWGFEDWVQWLNRVWEKIQDEPTVIFQIASVLLSVLPMAYMSMAHKRERIFLTPSGMQYQSPLPGLLQWFKPDWSIKWSQIRTAYFKPAAIKIGHGPLSMTLVIETASQRRKINPCAWIDPNEPKDTRPSLQWHTFSLQQTKHVLSQCPVVKYLTKMGIEVKMEAVENTLLAQKAEFALESNPHSLTAAILFFTFIGYGLLDLLINQETYAESPLYDVYLGGGVVAAILVMNWLIRAKVPKRESILVALLFGGAFGMALYPGLLRINQLTDTRGLQTYQYVLQQDYSLKPLNDSALPSFYFESDLDYWSHFDWDSIHNIELRKGGLNFYQINMAPIYADRREYFR